MTESSRDQRVRNRVRMDLPVRVRQIGPPRDRTEVTRTLDVSRNGLLFRTRELYDLRGTVWVAMPYNASTGKRYRWHRDGWIRYGSCT